MPQLSSIQIDKGRQVDPTFGLGALDAEVKRKTKAREQMNIAANVIRQSLAAEGKGLTKGTSVEIDEGGAYEFKGSDARKDESNLYNIRKGDLSKAGYGNKTQSREIANNEQQKAIDLVSGANLKQRGLMDVVATNAAALAEPSATLPDGTALPEGSKISSGASNSANINAGSASASWQTLLQKDNDVSIKVDDDLQMNQSDLAVASAMEALNSQVYGTVNPGVYKKMMDQNAETSKAKNEANKLEDHSSEQLAGRNGNVQQDFGSASYEQRKEAKASGGPGAAPKDKPLGYYNTREGATAEFELTADRSNVIIPGGTATDFTNIEKLTQIADRMGKNETALNAAYNMYKSTQLGGLRPVIMGEGKDRALYLYDGKTRFAKVMFDASYGGSVDEDGNVKFNGMKSNKTGQYELDDKGNIKGMPAMRVVYLTGGDEGSTSNSKHSMRNFIYASGQSIRTNR